MTTQIHFILDRSGSMDNCLDDTIGGFNSFVSRQQQVTGDECFLSLYQFDHEYQTVYQNKKIEKVQKLSRDTFVPRGNTALHDAIGRTIKTVGGKKYPENTKIVIVILTDGFENASREYNSTMIKKLITEYDKKENWSFVYLGANQDAIQTAGSMGITPQSTMNYSQTPDKVQKSYDNLSSALARHRMTPGNEKFGFTQDEQTSAQ